MSIGKFATTSTAYFNPSTLIFIFTADSDVSLIMSPESL